MEIEIQIVNDECNGFNTISMNLDIDKTIGDIINNLIKDNHINNNNDNNNNNNQELLLYHTNSGIIFGSNQMRIDQCIKQLNITKDDKLSLNLAQLFKSSDDNKNDKELNNNTENIESAENIQNIDNDKNIDNDSNKNINDNDNNSDKTENDQEIEETESKQIDSNQIETDNNNNNNNDNDNMIIINNLKSEIEQYRSQIANLEFGIIHLFIYSFIDYFSNYKTKLE